MKLPIELREIIYSYCSDPTRELLCVELRERFRYASETQTRSLGTPVVAVVLDVYSSKLRQRGQAVFGHMTKLKCYTKSMNFLSTPRDSPLLFILKHLLFIANGDLDVAASLFFAQ